MSSKLLVYFLLFVLLGCWVVTASSEAEKEEVIPEAVIRQSNGSQQILAEGLTNTKAASIYQSNMPMSMQRQLLTYVSSAYASSADRTRISQYIQSYMRSYQPFYRWNVVINYAAISYYSNYYAVVTQNNEYLIVFGTRSGSASIKGFLTTNCIAALVLIKFLTYIIN